MRDKGRACLRCERPIERCNGFVLARDLVAYFEDRIKGPEIREYCGGCVDKVIPVEGEPPYRSR